MHIQVHHPYHYDTVFHMGKATRTYKRMTLQFATVDAAIKFANGFMLGEIDLRNHPDYVKFMTFQVNLIGHGDLSENSNDYVIVERVIS